MEVVNDRTPTRAFSSQEKASEDIPNYLKWIATIRAFVCTQCQMLIGLSGVPDEPAAHEYATSLKRHLGEVHLLSFKTHILSQHVIKHLKHAINNNIPFVPFAPSAIPHERIPSIRSENAYICPKWKPPNSSTSCGFVALNRTNMLQHYAQAHPHESLPVHLDQCHAQKGFSNQFYVRVVDEESSSGASSKRKSVKAERPSSEDAEVSEPESDSQPLPKKQRASDAGLTEPPDLRESLRRIREFFDTIRFDPTEELEFESKSITDVFIWVPESEESSSSEANIRSLLRNDAIDMQRATVWLAAKSTETLGDLYLKTLDDSESERQLQIIRFLSIESPENSEFFLKIMICKYKESDLAQPFGDSTKDGNPIHVPLWDNKNTPSVSDIGWAGIMSKILEPARIGGARTAMFIGWPSFATIFYAAQCVTWPNTNEKIFKEYLIGAPPSFDLARDYAIFQLEHNTNSHVVN